MTTRILPVAEWSRLAHTDLWAALPFHSPEDMQIVVVEDGDRIVATWAVMRIVHFEGLWIDAAYRGRVGVARRLLGATMAAARRWAPRWAMTGAQSDDVRALITKHLRGVQIPMDSYVFPMETH